MRCLRAAVFLGCCVLLPGCALFTAQPAPSPDVSVELSTVPFYPQARFQCGPAALATVLESSGVAIGPDTLVEEIYLPGRRGSLQAEINAATRRHGRVPFPVHPSEAALADELLSGHPVLILQNLGFERLPRWHYAVVVGHLADEGRWVLRSGRERRRLVKPGRFSESWERAGGWGLVALPPGQLPAHAEAASVARTLAEAEPVIGSAELLPSWQAAVERWERNPDLAFGAGNAARAAGRLPLAGVYYRRALSLDGRHLATRNNLADLQLELGCAERALETLAPALQIAGKEHPLWPTLKSTARAARDAALAQRTPTGPCL